MASSDKNPLQYNRLLDFKKDIKEALQQTQIQAEILTKMTREKGLLPPGNASYEIALLVSYCIDNVGLNEQLFSKFLEFLKDAGQVHLVRRILVKVRTQQSAERDSRAPPSSASTSTRTRTQSLPHVLLSARRPSKSAVTRPPRVKSASLPDRGKLQQHLPSRVDKAPLVPAEEAQEDEANEGLVLPPAQQSTPTRMAINNQNSFFGTKEPETVNTELEEEIQELREDKELLTKEVQEKVNEIRAEAEKKLREKELVGYKAMTAELERELQRKDDENKEQEKHGKEINDLKEQIKEEQHKTKKKELEIKDLEKQLLQKDLEKTTLIRIYENEKRAIERERGEVKVKFAKRKLEDEKRKRITAEHKQEEEEQKRKEEEQKCKEEEQRRKEEEQRRKEAEVEKEEEKQRRKAAESEHRKCLDKIKKLEELLKSNGNAEPTVEHRYPHHQYDDDYSGICFLGEQLQCVVDSKGGLFAPADLGISLEVPPNAVPADETITLCGRPCLCGPFQYPEGYEALSAVYLITSKGSFQKEVELKMKHYGAVETEEQADQMCFLSAKCTPVLVKGKKVYDFMPIKGGKFAVHKGEGSLTLEHFCFITCGCINFGTNTSIEKKYCALFSKSKVTKGHRYAALSVSLYDDVYIQNFFKTIQRENEMETPNSMEVFFENNPATVILPPDPEGWIISPSIRPCQFKQEDVNEPRSKGEIAYPPRFIFTAIPNEHASFCIYEFELEGIEKTPKFPFPLYSAQKNAHPISKEDPRTLDISDLQKVQELLVDVKKEWYSLGLALGLRQPTLKGIKQNEDDIDDCKREMLTEWLNQVDNSKPTYPSLEVALEKDTVKCRPVANIVHKHYTQQN